MSTSTKFELLFIADTKQAKAATSELRRDVENLGGGANAAASALDKQTAALNREAEAARKAADSAKMLSDAEARAAATRANTGFGFETREQAEARLGLKSRKPTLVSPIAAPQLAPAVSASSAASSSLASPVRAIAGGVLPVIAAEIGALIGPAAIATAAVAGIGYAASVTFDLVTNKARKVSEVISEHTAQVRRLHEAYQYAGTGAEAYYQRINTGQKFLTSGTRKELERTLKEETRTNLSQLGSVGGFSYRTAMGFVDENEDWVVNSSYKEFEAAILHLQKTAKEGKPDILGFRELVEDRWRLDENNEGIRKTAKFLLDLGKDSVAAAELLEKSSAEAIRAQNAIAAAERRSNAFNDSVSNIRGIAALGVSDRRQVEKQYATASGNAGDRDDRADALRQRNDALARINDQEQRQIELARLDIQMITARDPLTRAEIAAQRERIQLAGTEIDTFEASMRVQQARDRVMAETIAQSSVQVLDMQDEFRVRQRLNTLVEAGTITSSEANRMLQEEAVLRPLITAAASAEGAEKQRLNDIISKLKAGYADLNKVDKQEIGLSMLQSGKDHLEMLQAEIGLVGASEASRAKSIALLETEQRIRREGIPVNSKIADDLRKQTEAIADQNSQLERSRDAWNSFRSAGENAISSVVDSLAKGDIKGALAGIAQAGADFLKDDIKKTFANDLIASCRSTLC